MKERRQGGEGCIGRVEGLGGVQAVIPAPGPLQETTVERGEREEGGEGVDGGEGGQRGGVDVVGDQAQGDGGQGQKREGGDVVERGWGVLRCVWEFPPRVLAYASTDALSTVVSCTTVWGSHLSIISCTNS